MKLSRWIVFFPVLQGVGAILGGIYALSGHVFIGLIAMLAFIYIVPLLAFKLHQMIFPKLQGVFNLQSPSYIAWWGTHHIQAFLIAFPYFERALIIIPGAFSAWLRLWGSTIGKNVYWAIDITVLDRSLLVVGDGVIIGYRCGFASHIIKPKKSKNGFLLFVQEIQVGSGSFVGAGTNVGPGVRIEQGTWIEVGSRLYPNSKHRAD